MNNQYAELLEMGLTEEMIDVYFKKINAVDNTKRFKLIIGEMADIYARKNKDYGNSFDESLDEDGLVASKFRIGDKYRRFSQLIKHDALVKDESIRDTLVDMANYAIMTVMWMDLQIEIEAQKKIQKVVVTDGNKSVGGFPHIEYVTRVEKPDDINMR